MCDQNSWRRDDGCCGKKNDCCVRKNECCEKRNECCEKRNECCPVMDDCLAKEIECLWKQCFCDATIVPCLGVPSQTCGVLWLTHTLGKCLSKSKINGLCVKSSLVRNAQYTAEVSDGQWVNLYSVRLPNIPGKCGCKSSTEVYVEALAKLCISVEGDTYGWKGECPNKITINSKSVGMLPVEFTKRQIAALKATIDYINCNLSKHD